MKKEKACGVITLKKEDDKICVLLIKHNLGHIGIPKGHVELGESEEETAIREVLEETGINSKIIDGFREVITYSPKENVIKDVVFFLGYATSDNIKVQEEEVQKVFFIQVEESIDMITHDNEKRIIEKVIDYLDKHSVEITNIF